MAAPSFCHVIHAPVSGACIDPHMGESCLRIACDGSRTGSGVVFYFGADLDLASDLADAINAVIAKHAQAAGEKREAA